jgi:hypothetical protein
VEECTVLVEKIVNGLFSDEHGLDVDERKETCEGFVRMNMWKGCYMITSKMQKKQKANSRF